MVRYIFNIYLYTLPLYITWIIDIVFAVRYQRQHPRSARFVLLGCGIALLSLLVLTPVSALLPLWFGRGGLATYSYLVSFAQTLLQALGWACLLAAVVVAWRAPVAAQDARPPDHDRAAP